jgi:hypothetical protein
MASAAGIKTVCATARADTESIVSDRKPSTRYEIGFSVAIQR